MVKISHGKVDIDPLRVHTLSGLSDIRDYAHVPSELASYENVKSFLEKVLKPLEKFDTADERINAIWLKHDFPLEDAIKLQQAISEFGNYEYSIRDGFTMTGLCLVIPREFESLVDRRFGIHLQHCELTGARQRHKEYSPEERAEFDAEREGVTVHEASIYRDTVIIDWTSRQFNRNNPIPEITDVNDSVALQQRIDIYR